MRIGILHFSADLFDANDVVSALACSGFESRTVHDATELRTGDILLHVGIDTWDSKQRRSMLQEAGHRGVHRVHWQLEPLLPPRLPQWSQNLVLPPRTTARRERRNPSQFSNHWRQFISLQRMAFATRGETWSPGLSAHSFKYPLQQTRALVTAHRENLFDDVLVSVATRKLLLEEYGIRSRHVPVGYLPKMGRRLHGTERDVDVLFLGKVSSRRARLLRSIGSNLGRQGFKLRVETGLFGQARTDLLNRTKLVLNIHKFPWEFPGMRLLMSMACGAAVVSETAPDTRPYTADLHFTAAPADMLEAKLIAHLTDGVGRAALAERAQAFAADAMNFGSLLSSALATSGPHADR